MPTGIYKRKRRPLKDRFFEKLPVDRDPDKCWEWKGCDNGYGYGLIGSGGKHSKMLKAHRVAWELANDQEVPEGMHVLHHCDNPPCCNISHLYIGTHADNMRDMAKRGRGRGCPPLGENHGGAKVPDWIVGEALKFLLTGVSQRKVAEMLTKKGYPCVQSTVSTWVLGKSRAIKS